MAIVKLDDAEEGELLGRLTEMRTHAEGERGKYLEQFSIGRAVWDAQFTSDEDRPSDTMYYPKVFGLLRHHVRAIRKTYASTAHIIQVHPEGYYGREDESVVSHMQREQLLYDLAQWSDMSSFIDDSVIAGEQDGVMVAKNGWVQKRRPAFDEEEYEEIDEKTGTLVTKVQKFETDEEEIIENHGTVEYISVDQVLWEPGRLVWSKVRWCFHIEIEYTEDELWEMVDDGELDDDKVTSFLEEHENRKGVGTDTETPKETVVYKLCEFWGYVTLKDDEREQWSKVWMSDDMTMVLSDPKITDDTYRDVKGDPINPFTAGYLVRKRGSIIGESNCMRGQHLQAEINCIRNQRRRSVEDDLTTKYIIDKNKDVEFKRLDNHESNTALFASGTDGVKEIRHWDNTSGSYNELGQVRVDLDELYGVNPLVLGMPDPHIADTAFGINLMSNNANTVIYDNIISFNDTFMEPVMNKLLQMSLQYRTKEELDNAGLDAGRVERAEMQIPFRIKVDTGVGATSDMVRLQNKEKIYFMLQNLVQVSGEIGVEVGPLRYAMFEVLRDALPLLGEKNLDRYIPTPESLEMMTAAVVAEMQKQQAQQQREQLEAQRAGQQAALSSGEALGQDIVQRAAQQGSPDQAAGGAEVPPQALGVS